MTFIYNDAVWYDFLMVCNNNDVLLLAFAVLMSL